FPGGFAVGALEQKGKTTSAVVEVLSPDAPGGRKIELGAVHGDVLPPTLVAQGRDLLVAQPDGAPNGTLVRLARVENAAAAPNVRFGASVVQGRDDSDAFTLAANDKIGLLAWDEWNAHAERGEVHAVTFPATDVARTSAPSVLSAGADDA